MVTKLLVTGGAGFMGSNFVHYVLETSSDYRIVVLDALTYAGNLNNLSGLLPKIEFVQGSILDVELVDKLVASSDIVVHFAAESHNDRSLENPHVFTEVNILGTENIASACLKYDKRLHHVSTDEVFGDLPLDSKVKFTEDSKVNPSSPYSASKAASDLLVLAWVRSFGLRATISNSANNFGQNQFPEKLIPRTVDLIRKGQMPKIYGTGLNVRDWLYVDDHSSAVLAILSKGTLGSRYLVSSGQLYNNIEVVGYILEAFGLPPGAFEFVSDRPGHDLKYASDSTKLQSETGWRPQGPSLQTWIQKSLESIP